jgi:hypothetical protein
MFQVMLGLPIDPSESPNETIFLLDINVNAILRNPPQ